MDRRLLVLDDERDVCLLITEAGEEAGYACRHATDLATFWQAYDEFGPTLLVLDLALEEEDGIHVLRALYERGATAGIILISGYDNRVLATAQRIADSLGLQVISTLSKPINIYALLGLLEHSVQAASAAISEDSLRAAIEKEQFELYYQPRVTADGEGTWKIIGAEALIRWHQPTKGLVLPGDFIPLAERTGAIDEITQFTFRSVVRQIAEWRREGFDLQASVNLSPSLLKRVDLPDIFAGLCAEHGIRPNDITLEITESGVMDDPTVSMEILSRARLKGFSLAIDDFGTGYSSLVQLYRMPFNELKIDREFVKDLPHQKEALEITSILIDLGRRLGLKLCAEGVETGAALEALRGLGCDIVQGYYISKPLTVTEFETFLGTWLAEGRSRRFAPS